jgi:hypothetical protein
MGSSARRVVLLRERIEAIRRRLAYHLSPILLDRRTNEARLPFVVLATALASLWASSLVAYFTVQNSPKLLLWAALLCFICDAVLAVANQVAHYEGLTPTSYREDLERFLVERRALHFASNILSSPRREVVDLSQNIGTNLLVDGKKLLGPDNFDLMASLRVRASEIVEQHVPQAHASVVTIPRMHLHDPYKDLTYEANNALAQALSASKRKALRFVGEASPSGDGPLVVVALMLDGGVQEYVASLEWGRRGDVYCVTLFVPAIFEGDRLDVVAMQAGNDSLARLHADFSAIGVFLPLISPTVMATVLAPVMVPSANRSFV